MGAAKKEIFALQTGIPGFYPVETCFFLYVQFLTHYPRTFAETRHLHCFINGRVWILISMYILKHQFSPLFSRVFL